MASLPIRSALLFAVALATVDAQELPKRSGPADFDFEPKLMLNDVPDVPLPGAESTLAIPQPPADIAKLEAAVERAKKNAAFRERLMKAGVLSKLEAEQGEMKVVRLTKDLENARLDAAKRDAEELQKKAPSEEALAEAEKRVATAATTAQEATAKWEQAQRAAAELRLQRERKLMALGAGSKVALKRAEAALQGIIGNQAPAFTTDPHP